MSHVEDCLLAVSDGQVSLQKIAKSSTQGDGEEELGRTDLEDAGAENEDLEGCGGRQDGWNNYGQNAEPTVPAANSFKLAGREFLARQDLSALASGKIQHHATQNGADRGHGAVEEHLVGGPDRQGDNQNIVHFRQREERGIDQRDQQKRPPPQRPGQPQKPTLDLEQNFSNGALAGAAEFNRNADWSDCLVGKQPELTSPSQYSLLHRVIT